MSTLCSVGGLTNIHWINRNVEISLIVNPKMQRKGVGARCVDMLLEEAFDKMGLKTVYGETYSCNPAGVCFWNKVCDKDKAYKTSLPNRKYWDGKFWDSMYFSIDVENWHD